MLVEIIKSEVVFAEVSRRGVFRICLGLRGRRWWHYNIVIPILHCNEDPLYGCLGDYGGYTRAPSGRFPNLVNAQRFPKNKKKGESNLISILEKGPLFEYNKINSPGGPAVFGRSFAAPDRRVGGV